MYKAVTGNLPPPPPPPPQSADDTQAQLPSLSLYLIFYSYHVYPSRGHSRIIAPRAPTLSARGAIMHHLQPLFAAAFCLLRFTTVFPPFRVRLRLASRRTLSSDPELQLEFMHDLPDESDSDDDFDGYLADSDAQPQRGEPGFELFTLRPLLNLLLPHFRDSYTPDQYLSIDESMISFKNRLSFLQYLPHACNVN